MHTNWIKKSAFYAVLVLLVWGVSELGAYAIWTVFLSDLRQGGVFQVKRIIGDPSLNKTQTIISNPYSLYWNNPNYEDEYGKQYDANGYRSSVYEKKNNEIRVLVLGGSTTNSYPYVKDPNKIWTANMQRMLQEKLDRPVHVFNAGLPSGTSAELMVHYLTVGKYFNPDLVIYHEGLNDVPALLYPNYKTDYSHLRRSTADIGARPFESFLLRHSYLSRLVYVVWLRGGGIYEAQPYWYDKVPREDAVAMVKNNPSVAFRSNVSAIASIAKESGSKVLLVGALQAKEENLSRNAKHFEGLEKAFILGVAKHSQIMRDVARNYGVNYLDLDQSRFNNEWFLDNCHLNEEGEKEKASQIYDASIKLISGK